MVTDRLTPSMVPMRRDGQVTHVLRLVMLAKTISSLLSDEALPEGWLAGILDRQGIFVARNIDAENSIGRPGSSALAAMARR